MTGVILLFVGGVLLVNGMGGLGRVDPRSMAVMNFMVGGLAMLATLLQVVRAQTPADHLVVAQFLLFTFTYLYVAVSLWWEIDLRGFGWFCLFVAITTIPCSLISYQQGDLRFGSFWLVWGALWFAFYLAYAHGRDFGKALPLSSIAVGVLTCWVPGLLILTERW
jgi:uncharacterized membrane protein